MIRKLFSICVLIASVTLFISAGASVQAADDWQVLGERTIKAIDQGISIENNNIGRIKKVKISIEKADVKITKVVFKYRIRRDDEFKNFEVVKDGGQITPIDVPGRKAKLRSIIVEYKILDEKETAVIKIWGLRR